jgi:hypothetical protein
MTTIELYAEAVAILAKWNIAGRDVLAYQIVDLAEQYHAQRSAAEREVEHETVAGVIAEQGEGR